MESHICTVCGSLGDLLPSPSGSGKLVCRECAEEIRADLDEMRKDLEPA